MAQWTVDPRLLEGHPDPQGRHLSDEVLGKAVEAFEAGVVVRRSRNGYSVPSWTKTHQPGDRPVIYRQILVRAPDRWSVVCDCDALNWCHHGWAVVLQAEDEERQRDPDFLIPTPTDRPARRPRKRDRGVTVVPGGSHARG
jgi:hypothetical protein